MPRPGSRQSHTGRFASPRRPLLGSLRTAGKTLIISLKHGPRVYVSYRAETTEDHWLDLLMETTLPR